MPKRRSLNVSVGTTPSPAAPLRSPNVTPSGGKSPKTPTSSGGRGKRSPLKQSVDQFLTMPSFNLEDLKEGEVLKSPSFITETRNGERKLVGTSLFGGTPASAAVEKKKEPLKPVLTGAAAAEAGKSVVSSGTLSGPARKHELGKPGPSGEGGYGGNADPRILSGTLPAGLPSFLKEKKGFVVCEFCGVKCQSVAVINQHLAGKRHRANLFIRAFKNNREVLKQDKDGIILTVLPSKGLTLTDDLDVKVVLDSKGSTSVIFELCNKGDEAVTLERNELLRRSFRHEFVLEGSKKAQNIPIMPGQKVQVKLHVTVRHIGHLATDVAFLLSRALDPIYKIHFVRTVDVQLADSSLGNLGPTTPYKRPPRVAIRPRILDVEDGLRLKGSETLDKMERKILIGNYPIPGVLRSALNHGLHLPTTDDKSSFGSYIEDIKKLLGSPVDSQNYKDRFSLLLHMEESQMEVDIRKYDLNGVTLSEDRSNRHLLKLMVPGLSEKRPSVLRGDHLFLCPLSAEGKPGNKEFKGYVHNVELNDVCLGFSHNFRAGWVRNMTYNCRFVFNRLPQRLQHRAIELARENDLFRFLFPTSQTVCARGLIQPIGTQLKFYNQLIEGNREQSLAIQHIVAGSSRPAPFLIFGPPGTGKTVTVVEAIKQVLKCLPKSHILACTPSNNSADFLAECLLDHVPKAELLRMNASSRSLADVPEKVKQCCNYERTTGQVCFPSATEITRNYKVIVCTLVTAGRLVSANLPSGHFTHIFIDEAGQAVEPESMIPLAGIFESDVELKDGGQVVLAGDPEQLGPVLRSPLAVKYGLETSLLERFMKHIDIYKRRTVHSHPPSDPMTPGGSSATLPSAPPAPTEPYDTRLVVKLVRNYRSHPDILTIPNAFFYDNELQAHADKLSRESLCAWEGLVRKGFPIIFHGVIGKEQREERSPSFFNTDEIGVVKDYVERLATMTKGVRVEPRDIGVIAPYRKQVQKFQSLWRNKKPFNEIKVGSVEEFQGLERRVIIVSTVRSSTDHLASDFHFKLGFLRNPKRFNVAITRPKALLIIVGNPFVLAKDKHWANLLKFCWDKKSYTGCEFDFEEELLTEDNNHQQFEDLLSQFDALHLNEKSLRISDLTHQVDPEWRGDL